MRTVEERLEERLEVAQIELSPEAIKRLKVMLSCMDRVRKEDPKYFEGFVKRLEDNSNDCAQI